VDSNRIYMFAWNNNVAKRFGSHTVHSQILIGLMGRWMPLRRESLHMTTPTMRSNAYGRAWCSRAPSLVLCVVLAFLCSGCFWMAVGAAGGVTGAVYVMGKLKDEVNYDVSTVHKATVAALTELDLKVLDDKSDKVTAHVESEFSDGEHVWINLESLWGSRTSLTIRVGVTGNEVRARKIYEAIKRHLS